MTSSEAEHVAGTEGESAKLIPWPTGGGGKVASEEVITQFLGNVKPKGGGGGMAGPNKGSGRPVLPGMAKAGVGGMGAVGAHLQQLPSPNDPRATRLWRTILCCLRPPCEDEYGAAATTSDSEPMPRPIRRPLIPPKRPTHCVMPPMRAEDIGKKTLVLDLDETLVHSSFKPIPNPDYIIPVEIDNRITDVYVLKRPWVDEFMKAMGEKFEVVVFTASLSKYADPLLDLLDPHSIVRVRLFRDSCCPFEGNYVKDLSVLGRHLPHTIIIDNSPHSYVFHPENAVPISTFIDDPEDQELLDLIPYLNAIAEVDDVTLVLGNQQNSFVP